MLTPAHSQLIDLSQASLAPDAGRRTDYAELDQCHLNARHFPEVTFSVHREQLLSHCLQAGGKFTFIAGQNSSSITALQGKAQELWLRTPAEYSDFVDRYHPLWSDCGAKNDAERSFVSRLLATPEFSRVFSEAERFGGKIKAEWAQNLERSSTIITDLTGWDFGSTKLEVNISHPAVADGRVQPERYMILVGGSNSERNYATIQIWHEALHLKLQSLGIHAFGDTNEAVIQFVCDNELRRQLNGGQYPPLRGHLHTLDYMQALLPLWQSFLAAPKRDLLDFRDGVIKQLGNFEKFGELLSAI